jgi:hypothetical protein
MKPIIHVGFSKTATTSLQDGLFSELSGVANLGKPFRDNDGAVKVLFAPLLKLNFDDGLSYDAQATRNTIRAVLAETCDKPTIVSSEGLSYFRHNDQLIVAQRLREAFGEARILFTIREQVSWLQSLYLDDCGRFTLTDPASAFPQWYREEAARRNRGAVQGADFYALIASYRELFGVDNVSVLPLEMMTREPDVFAEKLSDVINKPAAELLAILGRLPSNNARLSMRRYRFGLANYYFFPAYLRRFLPRLPAAFHRYLDGGPSARFIIPAPLVQDLRSRVAEGNRALAKIYDLKLEKYGYSI